jgi:prepilin-type N-terminal cleavage/methylation domain-containing protein
LKFIHFPQQGFTLLEGIVALSILTSLLVLGNHYTRQRLEASLHQQAAAHLRRVTFAAVRYAQDHTDYLGTTIEQDKEHENSEEADWKKSQKKHQDKKDDPISLEVWRYKKLLKQNYLPEISPRSERNLYGQGYALYILKAGEPNNIIQLLVITTGGKQLSERELRQIARQAGGQGGYISQEDQTQVTGSQQGWQLELPAETIYLPSPDKDKEEKHYERPGHLACLHTLHPDDLLHTKFLHRTPQPDQPQLNQMETDLRMQSHQIVFERQEPTGTTSTLRVNANNLQFEHHHGQTQKQAITLGYDKDKKRTHLEIKDPQKGSVVIEANRLTTTDEPKLAHTTLEGYSAPELHAYWNKIPYYELPSNMNHYAANEGPAYCIASLLCTKSDEHSVNKLMAKLGRFFMIGHKGSPATFLYLCGYGNNAQSKSVMAVPYLLAQFPQETSQATQRSTELSISLPSHSPSRSSLSPNPRCP